KRIFVLPPEIDTLRDTRISDEDWTIFLPGLDSLGRPRNCIKDDLFALRLGQHFSQLFAGKAIALGHLLDEFGYFFPFVVRSERHRTTGQGAKNSCSAERTHQPATP